MEGTAYDSETAKKAGSLSTVASILQKYEATTNSLPELHALLTSSSTDPTLLSLAQTELHETHDLLTTLITSLKTSLTPPHPFAHLPCLLELRPGAGGDEASLFTGDLLNMYTSYCKNHNLSHSILSLSSASVQGGSDRILEAVMEFSDAGSYGRMRCEAGVHRVQRVPITETKGRTHTSAVGVMVLPNIAPPTPGTNSEGVDDFEDPESDGYVNTKDVRVDTYRSSGAGGQHVNMTDSAVRLTHTPTGTVVAMQTSRSQHQNRERAWRLLRARIAQKKREEREEEINKVRLASGAGKKGLGRGDKVRTYNWAQSRVTDHRCGYSSGRLADVLQGRGSWRG
ncbi:uncharacterized protein KY384_006215 [Bacidia gigantensis]|uniref:uncharacterized protein n=1 Tax=Bacidia gigantensis TaxID=2732470 RepID=UPI001D03C13C|nr:uncharacterized protein KY384_006215 [Bacidia gigantensis]KAG8529578.1 hypothetical protein KY384_006215 [Bacidia gigantensis]